MIDFGPLEAIASTLLHEGRLLYPYRASAPKNRLRWTFGCLFPPAWSALGEPSWLRAECLLRGGPATRVSWRCRFLYLSQARPSGRAFRVTGEHATPSLTVGPATPDAVAGCVDGPPTTLGELTGGRTGRTAFRDAPVQATWQASAADVGDGVFRLSVRIDNVTQADVPCPPRDEALGMALLSCHLLLGAEDGAFVSMIDPPPEHRERAAACRNVGVWPVLAGDPAAPPFVIAAPIILYDHPQIAPQSPAALFEATEIDEMLRLRVLTLADSERQEAAADGQARDILERLGGLGEGEALALRGVWRAGPRPGDRVRLRPARRADAFDHALSGREATVVSVDEDLEGRRHVGVVIDDDPGRDLGLAGWPGHRFFFAPEEVEPL